MNVKEGVASTYCYHAVYESQDQKAVCGMDVFSGDPMVIIDPKTGLLRNRIFAEVYDPGPDGIGRWCSKCKQILGVERT